ncbi:MAG: hypothetical protein PHV34_11120 [Verrucomicrobiae bacterium]|nr:hypothetical protein [Verrucomicrobiae bacterium]
MPSLILALLVTFVCYARAQSDFRYYVGDIIKTTNLCYEVRHDVSVYLLTKSAPRLSFRTEYLVAGCTQPSFSYTEEDFNGNITPNQYNELIRAVKALGPEGLDSRGNKRDGTWGWLDLGRQQYQVTCGMDNPKRAKLHKLILAFLDQVAPKAKRNTTTETTEGDLQPALEVKLNSLFINPVKYHGKRVRVAGYYHGEFECSSFSAGRGGSDRTADDRSLWLGGSSAFAKEADVKIPNDSWLQVDGVFLKGPAGHMGMSEGEVARLTRVLAIPKPPP